MGAAHPAHAAQHATLLQMPAECQRCVLPALVAVMDDSRFRLPVVNSHFQGRNDQAGVDAFTHAPADYGAGVDVYGD